MSRNETQSGLDSLYAEIGCHAQPRENRSRAGIQRRCRQDFRQRLLFEVTRHKDQIWRDRNRASIKAFALYRLRRRMIDLENPESLGPFGLSVSERVESGPEHDVLPDAVCKRVLETILGEAA